MSRLAPDLFERRFDDLVALGRARLPALAPEWTDHNAHDPGITLMELLAWVAEAQLYALSTVRRDERLAYAALLGVAPEGTRPARGLVWPDPRDPASPPPTSPHAVVIPEDAAVHVTGAETPAFRPAARLLWAPGRIRRLEARGADGSSTDLTAANDRGGPAFAPFGAGGPRDVLALTFECSGAAGLLGPDRAAARGARWSLGVRAAPPLVSAGADASDLARATPCPPRAELAVTLVAGGERLPLRIVEDSTDGLLRTGALLLDLDGLDRSPRTFTIELRARDGFARAPRLLQLAPGVVPIVQSRSVSELHEATGAPDWAFDLAEAGLRFAAGEEPVAVDVAERSGPVRWIRCERLSERGPGERVYELDAGAGRITFGNGVNGALPPAGAQVFARYDVSDGEAGCVARNRRWEVAGLAGTFGVNPDPIDGGLAAPGFDDQRREARRRARAEHALVSADDLVAAATGLELLEIARAWVPPLRGAPPTGLVTLVALRARGASDEPAAVPETRRWLAAIRRSLAPRLPLGTRLAVVAPRYAPFSLDATVEADAGRDPAGVEAEVRAALRRRLSLAGSSDEAQALRLGMPLSRRDVVAWIRGVDGVRRVIELRLRAGAGQDVDEIPVPRTGLPRWDAGQSAIRVTRAKPGVRG